MYLALNGSPVPIAYDPTDIEVVPIGDAGRAAGGAYLSSIDARKAEKPLRTPYLAEAEYVAVRSVLDSPPPVMASGRLVGAGYPVAVQVLRTPTTVIRGETHRAIEFMLRQR
jgi:hypothetical protein